MKVSNPELSFPVGWDQNNYKSAFPTKRLPFLKIEQFGDPLNHSSSGRLIWGDNLAVMRSMPSESIDLIYIDPPFFSGKTYNCIFGDLDEVRSFSDIWEGGLPSYLAWLNARLWEMKRLLKPNGSLFIHLDWHAVHYVKIELDKIFGYDRFINEIIWHYTGGGRAKDYFSRKHDVILWYAKSNSWTFNIDAMRVPYKETSGYAKSGITSASGKRYLPNPKGTPIDDTWDIPIINPMSKERIGYPTQKPESLLERIIEAASRPGDCVADFFAGGGTTLAVAATLGRSWIGCDISKIAISVARDRLCGPQKPQRSDLQPAFVLENHGAYEPKHGAKKKVKKR